MRKNILGTALISLAVLAVPGSAWAQAPAQPGAQPSAPSGQSPMLDFGKIQETLARMLANGIQTAHDETIKAGVSPIPAAIRKQLAAVFPLEMLDRVRYRVGREGTVGMQAFQYGHVQAMTLIDIIVFRNEADALTNDALWAHELTHVRQYDRWGLQDFALRYVQNYKMLEDEAYGFADDYTKRKLGVR